MPMDNSALMEAFRRRAGKQRSFAGLPGGAQTANAPIPTNPLAAIPQERQQMIQNNPNNEFASAAAIRQGEQAKPNESEIIVKALIQRLRRLSDAEMPKQKAQT